MRNPGALVVGGGGGGSGVVGAEDGLVGHDLRIEKIFLIRIFWLTKNMKENQQVRKYTKRSCT